MDSTRAFGHIASMSHVPEWKALRLAERTTALHSLLVAPNAAATSAHLSNDIIDLTTEEIWSDLAPSARDGAISAINSRVNRYTEAIGLFDVRSALARRISAETGQPWSADEVAITNGGKQAFFNAALALLNHGDEVLIPTPYWTSFPAQIVVAGGTPVFVDTRRSNYIPRLTDLAAAVTSRTKAIVVNTPHNPTGVVYDRDTLESIAQFAKDRDIWIIFDECCGAFAHAPHIHHPLLAVAPGVRNRTLIVNSFSKSLALTGWRIGYLAAPRPVISAINALQGHTTANVNVVAQHALLHYLERGDLYFQALLQRQVANARALGLSILSSLTSVPQPPAQGGLYFYLDLTELQRRANAHGHELSADDVARVMLANAGVAIVSGTAFGDAAGIRLSYGGDLESLGKGLRRLSATLNEISRNGLTDREWNWKGGQSNT
ncbi:aminotransferase class I/II-fold pyridoxal phosphate-dependent enzyme [Bradyrhizobium sp. ISRA442]|uniref:pyridoxal phosphate-dependent aminotransferase n=1 Tax=Bradyrhizobium sp. ISRA442 TaxID=2866197 RepID=UPI00311AD28D